MELNSLDIKYMSIFVPILDEFSMSFALMDNLNLDVMHGVLIFIFMYIS